MALVKFQSEVQPIVKKGEAKIETKTGRNYSYTYADLSDIWDAIRKPLKDCGLAVTQFLKSNETTDFVRTTIWHENGESVSEDFALPTAGKTPQEVGSVITYYKRYALGAALGISTEEDDDGNAGNKKPEPVAKTAKTSDSITDAQKQEITELAKQLDYTDNEIKAKLSSIRTSQLAQLTINKLKADVADIEFSKDM